MQELLAEHWPAMQAAVESGGGEAVVALIEGQDDPVMRHLIVDIARRGLIFNEWRGKNFDDYITVIDAGIEQLLAEAEALATAARVDVYRGLHALCSNLTADLADCWPDDDAPRSRSHHERGLRAAEDCLRWLDHLPGRAGDRATHTRSLGARHPPAGARQHLGRHFRLGTLALACGDDRAGREQVNGDQRGRRLSGDPRQWLSRPDPVDRGRCDRPAAVRGGNRRLPRPGTGRDAAWRGGTGHRSASEGQGEVPA